MMMSHPEAWREAGLADGWGTPLLIGPLTDARWLDEDRYRGRTGGGRRFLVYRILKKVAIENQYFPNDRRLCHLATTNSDVRPKADSSQHVALGPNVSSWFPPLASTRRHKGRAIWTTAAVQSTRQQTTRSSNAKVLPSTRAVLRLPIPLSRVGGSCCH